jgi:hypothetical protein
LSLVTRVARFRPALAGARLFDVFPACAARASMTFPRKRLHVRLVIGSKSEAP